MSLMLIIEICALVITLILGVLWINNPEGNYEPYTVLCGCVAGIIEVCRRFQKPNSDTQHTEPSKLSSKQLTIEWLKENSLTHSLPDVLSHGLKLAQITHDQNLEHWINLELFGYYQANGMQEDEVVPEYREVTGRYYDQYGRMLHIPQKDLDFVNTHRFRDGIEQLQKLAQNDKVISIREEDTIEMLKKYLEVDVYCFNISPSEITGIISNIRNEFIKRFKSKLA